MQITLVLDSVATNPLVLVPPDSLTFIRQLSWMAGILQYGGHAQFFKIFNFQTPPFYNMAARALFLNVNQHFTIWRIFLNIA